QLEAGKFVLCLDDFDLCGMVEETVAKFAETEPARAADIAFHVEAERLPIRADRHAVEQMVLKLLSNAAKFSEPGTPITIGATAMDQGSTRLSIRDRGIGMTDQQAEAAVNPFRQADERLERRYEGSGLGLSIVGKLIERHGGSLQIVSAPGQGTEVTLYFPPPRAEPTAVAANPAERIRRLATAPADRACAGGVTGEAREA
ncbi:MAG TPA: ATP-binding protein, partial [Stellaceae bacterium]|nr:ATP-binding protein [Stellaceae bacterium]